MALAFERRELPSNSRSSDLHVKQMSLCVEEIHGPGILTGQIRAQLALLSFEHSDISRRRIYLKMAHSHRLRNLIRVRAKRE